MIDTLVIHGYLTREVDPADRRRMTIELTDHGRAGARAIREGVEAVDAELARALSGADLAALRNSLAAPAEIDARAA